ncbi:MAG: DUF819 family protein, partial [Gemmatimonadetes bacterium]|nr:DUF819 family protein [Gemmatimonadota bacterium]
AAMDPTTALLTDPMAVFAYLAAVLGFIFWLSGIPRLARLFEITPPVIYAYFVPTLSTTFGITPAASPAYDWMIRYLLPVALLLLMITIDLRSVAKLGWMALIMVVAGTLGIVVGGPIALLLFGGWLPEDAWMGFAALSGSWIGGTANMVAIAESVGTPDSLMGPIIVVDTVVGYGWMGVLLFFSAWQQRFDRRTGARTAALEETNLRLAAAETRRHPVTLDWMAAIVGVGFAGAVVAVALGDTMPALGDPTIISKTTWAVLIVVTGGLFLSFTPLARLEDHGASKVGYLALYLLLTAIGARADLRAVLAAPAFLAAGIVWLAIHAGILLLAARLIRAPLFFVATGSMANIGGAASAPVVAGVYHPAMAPVGLLMAVVGYILGIYGGLVAAWLLAVVGG